MLEPSRTRRRRQPNRQRRLTQQQQQRKVMKKQVPRGTHHVSPSVISSSKINQGDLVAADSSSSSGSTPQGTDVLMTPPTPSLPLFIPITTTTNTTTIYASLSDINCSSNAKTYSNDDDCGRSSDIAKSQSQVLDDDVSGSVKKTKFSVLSCIDPAMRSRWVDSIGSDGFEYCRGWGLPKGLGLRGGGENSLTSGTSGWGTPPTAAGAGWGGAAPGPAQGQWGGGNRPAGPAPAPNANPNGAEFNNQNKPGGANVAGVAPGVSNPGNPPPGVAGAGVTSPVGGQPPVPSGAGAAAAASGNTSWAQAAGKGLPQGPAPTPSSTTKQIEQLNSMREALFAQDGWGGQHVNQDTSWDAPGTPEPAKGDGAGGAGAPMWKQNVNNGTDLWEANLRNGGQPPAQPQNKTPWGHTPTTNIGGTWGEEDESSETCNVWNGAPGAPAAPGPQGNPWPGAQANPWPEKKPEWGAGPVGPGAAAGPTSQWGDPRAPVPPMDPRGDPRDPNNLPLNDMSLMRMRGDAGALRGDPRGVSGRLNSSEQMWAAHQPPPTPKLPGLPPAGNQWSGGLPKDMGGMVNQPGKPSGWEEPSPPAQRRNIPPNYDDGTSLWGQQPPARLPQPASALAPNNKQWDKLPGGPGNNMGRGNMPCPTAMPGGARMPGAGGVGPGGAPGTVKPDGGVGPGGPGGVWGGPGRNGGWDHDTAAWDDSKLAGNWPGESRLTPTSWQGGKPGGGGGKPAGWGEDAADGAGWGHPSMQRPTVPKLTPDYIYASKQFRVLCDMNYKKEDVETALRSTNMSVPDAMELLASWGRHEDHSYDQSMLGRPNYNPVQSLNFPPGNGAMNQGMGGMGNKMNTMPNQVGGGSGQAGLVGGQPRPNAAQPSAQQLKMLIQQIQMAVQTGYLNHQILNQPLAPPTLLLVNQLLQQIKLLQQLNQRHQYLSLGGQLKTNPSLAANLSLQMQKAKQNIQNYQNQITGHQANYVKQQAVQQLSQAGADPGDLFKSAGSFADPLAQLANFGDLSMSDKTSMSSFQTQSQSRLNQWKLPSLDKEGDGNEFSRAPGSAKLHSSNLTETWSSVGVRGSDGGWPDSTAPDLGDKEWSTPQQSNSIADFIPEFEPGKPWKGTQMKTAEDDPSMTPGSVARSPLSMASIKDSDILSDSNKASPGPTGPSSGQENSVLTSLGLSTSPWTTLNSATSSIYTSPLSKLSSSKSWGESAPSGQGGDSWLLSKTARGPPPGMGSKLGQPQSSWGSAAGSRGSWGSSPSWGSPWLILRNLTPQIDGSTLKTLCMQHGPLQNFHLHLNVGTALAKYSTREEANKAQQALNNCVLGNTTIFAESPGESEVATLLNQLGHANSQPNQQQQQQQQQPQQTNWNIRTSQANPSKANDTWATSAGSLPGYGGSGGLWQSSSSSSSLWGSDQDTHRSTPSGTSLNSFLPPDLLNGETM